MINLKFQAPVPIESSHEVVQFDCGVNSLNEYLQKYALLNHQSKAARTYVTVKDRTTKDKEVVGYYTLAAGSVRREETPKRVSKGLSRHPVPIILIARLAVDCNEQGKGLGKGLLRDAILRSTQAGEIIGCRALLTHAKNAEAQKFYKKYGFEPSPIDELHMYLLMKDIKPYCD